MAGRKSRCVLKENRIPIGKKRENLEKIEELKKSNVELDLVNQALHKNKTSKIVQKSKVVRESKPLKMVNINVVSTDTSLSKPFEKPRSKLSTIEESEEKVLKSIKTNAKKTKPSSMKTITKDTPILVENVKSLEVKPTNLVMNQQVLKDEDNFNNTIKDVTPKHAVPEIVLSPFVCTTRGQKWKPSPRRPPKLSELFHKYEDDNIADLYRKKLDGKTIELQNKVKYWEELSSENEIPQSIKDEIDVVCGQTKLLTTDKFMQMRSLIEEFDNKSGSMPITITDLDGFWDMLLLQVEKLERQFSELAILKDNNWAPLQPVAKKVISKVVSQVKRPEVKSKFSDFLRQQKLKEKKITPNSEKNDSSLSKFHEMKSSNNTCLISSTPTSSNHKNVSFTPMLLKTMELSYVARRSGMTPIILAKPHVSPLKPALKNPEREKGIKRKNIHFESPKVTDKFITPENSCNESIGINKKSIQDRVATPHTIKMSKVARNKVFVVPQNSDLNGSTNTNGTKYKMNLKKDTRTKVKEQIEMTTEMEQSAYIQNNKCPIRRSSRLANKPSKNYKC